MKDSDRVLIMQREEEVIEIDSDGVVHPIGTDLKSVVIRDPEGEL